MVYTISVVYYQAWIMFFGLVEEIISGLYRKVMDGGVHHCATGRLEFYLHAIGRK